MRKYLFLFFFLVAIFGASTISLADGLWSVSLVFCDTTGNTLRYTIDPGTPTDICYTLTNSSQQDLIIRTNFVDGTYTNDKRQNKACLGEDEITSFGQYVTNYTREVPLAAGESKQDIAKLLYPQWTDGLYHGCVTYTIVQAKTAWSTDTPNFTILMRKAQFIDVLVGHPEDNRIGGTILADFPLTADNLSSNPKINIYIDPSDNKYVIQLHVQNSWNTEEDFAITGVVSNFLTYKHTFTEQRKILKGGDFTINWRLDEIPLYDITVDIQLSHTPIMQGSSPVIPETSSIHERVHIFVFNIITYITLFGLFVLLLIIILLLKKKKKQYPYYWPYPYPPGGPYPYPPQVPQPWMPQSPISAIPTPIPQVPLPPVSPTV